MSCGVGCRRGSDPALLWLWHRLSAIAPILPLAWDPPCATGAAQEMVKRPKKKSIMYRKATQMYLQRKHTEGQKVREKMLNITNY